MFTEKWTLKEKKKAAKLYVDAFEGRDQLSLVSFNSVPSVDVVMDDHDDVRPVMMTEIDSLVASGMTSVGAALLQSISELDDDGFADSDWNIVLLTDAGSNVGDNITVFVEE